MHLRQKTRAWTKLSTMRGTSKSIRFHRVRQHTERKVELQEIDNEIERTRETSRKTKVLSKMRLPKHQLPRLLPSFHLEMPRLWLRRRFYGRRRPACRRNTKTLPSRKRKTNLETPRSMILAVRMLRSYRPKPVCSLTGVKNWQDFLIL